MHLIVPFALFSTRRQEEITRIEWADLDEEHARVLVRDMKNPGQKIGNDVWIDLPPEALSIVRRCHALMLASFRIRPTQSAQRSRALAYCWASPPTECPTKSGCTFMI